MERLFRLKTKIFFNHFRGISMIGVVFLCALAAGAIFSIIKINEYHKCYVFGGVLLALSAVHLSRKDYHFCEKILKYPSMFFLIEYSLVTIPFAILSAIKGDTLLSILYAFSSPALSLIPQPKAHRLGKSKPLNVKMPSLEASSFFRRYRTLIWAIYILCLALTFANAVSMLLLYFLILFYAASSFSQAESISLLSVSEKPAKDFLNNKIRRDLFFWGKLSIPIEILYICFNIETAYLVLIPLLFGSMFIITCISFKYADYVPSRALHGTVGQALCSLGYLIPLFFPLSLFMMVVYYRAALDNLKPYLDDFYNES